MGSYIREDVDRWFDYSYLPSKRLIYVGSIDAESGEGGESGTDCQMTEYFVKAIVHLNTISSKPIIVHMNNLGGSWYHGMAMYDAIVASKAHVYGVCWGHAMSMGSIIVQGCDSRIVSPNCTFMIHDGSESLTGTCKTVEAWAKYAGKLRHKMYDIYLGRMKAAKPRINIKKIEAMCSECDCIFTAEEAVKWGLADWVLESMDDPYHYYATDNQNAKWKCDMKLGKRTVENSDKDWDED